MSSTPLWRLPPACVREIASFLSFASRARLKTAHRRLAHLGRTAHPRRPCRVRYPYAWPSECEPAMRAIVATQASVLEFAPRTNPYERMLSFGIATPHSAASYCRYASQWLTARHFVLLCREMPMLRQLTVAVGVVSDTQLAHLGRLHDLQRLDLTFYDAHPRNLVSIVRDVPTLRGLSLCWRDQAPVDDSPYNSFRTRLSSLNGLALDLTLGRGAAWQWNPAAREKNAPMMDFVREVDFPGEGALAQVHASVRQYIVQYPALERELHHPSSMSTPRRRLQPPPPPPPPPLPPRPATLPLGATGSIRRTGPCVDSCSRAGDDASASLHNTSLVSLQLVPRTVYPFVATTLGSLRLAAAHAPPAPPPP